MENLFQINIKRARESILELKLLKERKMSDIVHCFLDALLDLNLLKHRRSEFFDEEDWNAFVQETAGYVNENLNYVSYYLTIKMVPYDISWEYDEWKSWTEICLLLSRIAFLKETYKDHIPDEKFETITDNEVKEFLRSRSSSGDLPDEYIPTGLPSDHWWWRYPQGDE